MATHSFYEVLGVDPDADAAAIRRAYLHAARRHHPDHHADDPASAALAEDRMRDINEAWAVLGDTARRAAHDRELARRTSGPQTSTVRRRSAPPADEAGSGVTAPRRLTMIPPALLFAAIVCFAVGMVLAQVSILAVGLALAVLGGISFVLAPVVTMHRSRQ